MRWKVWSWREDGEQVKAVVTRRCAVSEGVRGQVAEILDAVRRDGDRAVMEFTRKYDGVSYERGGEMRVELRRAFSGARLERAARYALRNIERFARRQRPRSWVMRNEEGAEVGESYHPLERVGIYVPGGAAPLISTALMTVGVARAAGVREIVVMTPPPVSGDLQAALALAGATEVYGVGGAQAVGAMAFGTETVRAVDKVCGPGNAYVVEAKRQVMGWVAVDQLPGPSEIAVLADDGARVDWVAADVLAQAEHGHGSQVLVVGVGEGIFGQLFDEMERQWVDLKRREYLLETLERGALFVRVGSVDEGVEVVERYAPEHLSLQVRGAGRLARQIRNAGAIFVGGFSAVAAGDYVAGPSHTLPTGGAARMFAGLTVMDFMKRTSVVRYDRGAIEKVSGVIEALALAEGLDAHAASVRVRGGCKL
ncbi:MAG: histidinol dehydrogenase [Methylacidiphilales bacterium]|nr:histidinol dehydrogenase [Candidatus Methylacidiphilales bacterium]MDW8349814.1 histidinol dehydrogenase [Verrucomicrobiae bacterium]